MQKKRDIYAIVRTYAGKSLVDQAIPVVIASSILVILPIIALMEDHVRAFS